ncbi:uncharacterized protein LOC128391464 isoform X2 [Panonychus citri]|uniref:uncharacterized protein LOC128391464 isoform X2 n=3 Tax=Panonychus citri TaxID=50023 RepID=UPI002307A370|nr:uncharacterized protein LOC128391464 isoform X2 [Panonychus citri]
MNLDDCNSSSSSSVTSSPSSSSSTSSHSPSSSRSSSPQPTATNPITVEESEEKNSALEEITSKNENNTDYQQNDNLITIDNNSSHLFQKQLSPIREESFFPQEEKLESSPPLLSPSPSPSPQPQHIHKQSSSSPPPPLLSPSSLSTPCSSSHQPLTSMSTDQILTDFMTTTKQTSPSSPLPQDDSPPSPQLSTHSTSGDDSTIPDIENKANNNYLSSTVVDVPMDESGTSSLPNTPTSSSPSPSKLTNLNRKRKVSTTDSMMTAIVSGSPTASSIPPIIKSQSTLSDSFVKPSPTPEPGTTATTTSSSIAIKLSPPPTSPQPPPPPPPLLPPPLTSKLSNVDDKLLKELSQSSLINSLIQNSPTPSSTLPGVQKSLPPPLSLSSGGLAPTIQTTPTSSSNKQQQQQQPIYVAISTNPLILVPLSYNTETGGLDLSLANSSSVVKLPNDALLNSQLNGLIASGIDRSTLLNNSLETHRTGVENNNRANLINGIDATNIINVNSLTNNNIISINNNNNGIISPGDNVNNLRNLNLNNIQQLSQFSGRPQSTEGPLDLSSNPSSVDPKLHDKLSSFRSHNRHRDNDHRSSVSSYTVKNETDPMIEESESPSPLNLFNSPSTFANLVSSAHSADLPQSTASVLAAAAVAAAAAASVSSPPSSSSLAVGNSSGRVSGSLPLPGPAPNAPPSFTPEAVFKQSSYHCEHCHIGFYKKENYNIHKRFYCSARRSKAAAAAALAAASAGGVNARSRNNTRTRSESSPDLLESDGSPNSSPEISLDSEKTDRNLTHHLSSGHHQQPASSSLRKSSTSRRVSISSKTNASNSSNSPGSSPPHQPLSQYYCVACGIRFTSLDNLQAHQTYYCLKRNSVNASPDKLQYIVSIPGGTGSEVSCVKCKATYCNEEAFLSHVCSAMNLGSVSTGGSNGSKYNSTSTSASSSAGNASGSNDGRCSSAGGGTTSGNGGVSGPNMRRQEREDIDSGQQCFRCTICGYKGQTLQGMRIHVRMHSQCFRCTICGYKGHTLRGMRTHVRIHQDKIQGLPEETFIACIEDEALVAKSTTRSGPSGSKRRRKSLDAYSNSSNVHNQFGSSSTLSSLSNVIVSENSKPLSSQLINNLLPSTIANTSTGPAGILVSAGFTSMNNVNNNNSGTNDELISANVTNSNRNSSNNANNLNSSHSEISSENEDEATSNISENEMSGRDDSRQGGSGESVHNCHLCYYSSTYKGNVVRHLKLVHKDNSGGSGNSTNGPFSGINKRDSGDKGNDMDVTSGGGSGGGGGDSHGSISDELPLDLKATRSNGSTISERRTFHNRSPIGNNNHRSAGSPIDHNSNGSSSNNNNSNSNNNGSSNSSAQAKKAVPKYCRSCDISFQFLTSFIAHKKYYCSSHSNDPNAIQHLPESKSPV